MFEIVLVIVLLFIPIRLHQIREELREGRRLDKIRVHMRYHEARLEQAHRDLAAGLITREQCMQECRECLANLKTWRDRLVTGS